MFSSNLFAQFASSFHVYPPSFFAQDKEGIYFNHTHDLFANQFFQVNHVAETSQDFISRQLKGGLGQTFDHHHPLDPVLSSTGKKVAKKKDRYRKIFTAQGPRDRRIRLSIDIASKFFNLQDMLGFDKASKTLDWLFTKSKSAINELVEMKPCCLSSAASDCEAELIGDDNEEGQEGVISKKKCVNGKGEKIKQTYRSALYLLARKSRAEARARARERTREKMQIKKLNELKELHDQNDVSPPSLNQNSNCWGQIDAQSKHIIVEPVVNQNLLKPSSICSYQQNHIV